jgi:putative addiction module killer protein
VPIFIDHGAPLCDFARYHCLVARKPRIKRIVGRIRRMEMGNPGDTRGVGHGILEMRIDYGPGYRIYYVHRGAQIVILLCGGDKRTQPKDIKRAQKLAETL